VSVVWFILLIGGLITIHELGHLVAARLFDIAVLKVSIGFGPKLISWRRGATEYAVSAIPLGGYVRLLGEDAGDPVPTPLRARAFHLRPAWQRLVVILAGPTANLICPIFIFVHLYIHQDSARSATIGTVLDGQPARAADLRPGDRVVAVDDETVASWDDFNRLIGASPGRELRITVERPGQDKPLTKVVTPRAHVRADAFGVPERVGMIGVAPHYRLPQIGVTDPDSAAAAAGLRTFDVITSIQGRPITTAAELEPLFAPRSGGMIVVTYLRPRGADYGFAGVARLGPASAQLIPKLVGRSYVTGLQPADLFVASVEPGTPASRLGLRTGDVLTTLDGARLTSWELFAQALEEHPEAEHALLFSRDGVEHAGTFKLEPRRELDEYQSEATSWVFGVETARAVQAVPEVAVEPRLGAALGAAIGRAISVTGTLARVVGLTLTGRLPATALGGPILIYQVAGVAAQHGVEQFLVMAALVSLNLGLLNLLPVPLLDGGQAALVIIEAVRRRPVSARARDRARWIGLALLLALLVLASSNDLLRHFRHR
jgi:regulator of sigma E protease